jgi:hypothetical protein
MDAKHGHIKEPFKVCTDCGHVWVTRDAFLADPNVVLLGYQSHLDHVELGLLLFNHRLCGTTMSLYAETFTHLYDGPRYTVRKADTPKCPGYCLDKSELRPCPQRCECAYIREILAIIKAWPKG